MFRYNDVDDGTLKGAHDTVQLHDVYDNIIYDLRLAFPELSAWTLHTCIVLAKIYQHTLVFNLSMVNVMSTKFVMKWHPIIRMPM